MVSKQREYQIRMKEEGRCGRCGRIKDGKSMTYCVECLAKRAEESRNRYDRKKKVKKRLRRWDELEEVLKFVEKVSKGTVLEVKKDYIGVDYFVIEKKGKEYSYELIEFLEKFGRGDLVDKVYEIIDAE